MEFKKIDISLIDNFENHPFQLNHDNFFDELVESISLNGLLNPIIVRKKDNNRYEIISGHRRKEACELIGINMIDAFIEDLSDDEAIIRMVDSNIQREKLLPSEKAYAYKMKMEALKHQGKKTCATLLHKSRDEVSTKDSGETVRKFIRLTNLIPEILELIDNTVLYDKRLYLTMGVTIGVELSYLSKEEQKLVYNTITYVDATPTLGQAKLIRKLSENHTIDFNKLEEILSEKKGIQNDKISFNKNKIEEALPREILSRDKKYIEKYIIEAIIQFSKKYNVH